MTEYTLQGKTAAVIGVGGMGKAIVSKLAESGVRRVFLGDKSFSVLPDIGKDSSKLASNLYIHSHLVDVSSETSREEWIRFVRRNALHYEAPVDILIYTAGILGPLAVKEFPSCKEVKDTFEINYFAAVDFMERFMKEFFVPQKSGRIIMIGSLAGFIPFPGAIAYDATKAALNMFTAGLGQTVALWQKKDPDLDIRANCIAPAMVETSMIANMREKDKERQKKRFRQKEIVTPDQIAKEVIFLLSRNHNGVIADGEGNSVEVDIKRTPLQR